MAHMPAHCDVCGLTFFSGIEATNTTQLQLASNFARCPRCRSWARIVSGTFDIPGDDDKVVQTGGEPVDPEYFTRLGLILLQAKADNLKPEEIIEKVAPHSLALASSLARVRDNPVAFATVLAAAIGAIGAVTAALIISGSAQPTVINNYTIQEYQSEGRQLGLRGTLHELRERKAPIPPWVRDYIEPK